MPKNRGSNYTEREKHELLAILEKYIGIIDNKKTDNKSVKEKQEKWNEITLEYNSVNERPRTAEQLKNCYQNIKRTGKKRTANDRVVAIRTGRGTFVGKTTDTDEQSSNEMDVQITSVEVGNKNKKKSLEEKLADYTNQREKKLEMETDLVRIYNEKRIELINMQLEQQKEEHHYKIILMKLEIQLKEKELEFKQNIL